MGNKMMIVRPLIFLRGFIVQALYSSTSTGDLDVEKCPIINVKLPAQRAGLPGN
jgi:hypothetical protein